MSKKCLCIVCILTALLLQGCSLTKRNQVSIPYQAVAVTGKASPTLLGQLQFDILTYIDIRVAISPKDADLIVEILDDAPNSAIASYAASGQISAYDLNDVVVFRAFDKEGRELITPTEIFAVRNINYSPHTVLSSDIQQAQMVEDMRKELAMQITLRLVALGYRK